MRGPKNIITPIRSQRQWRRIGRKWANDAITHIELQPAPSHLQTRETREEGTGDILNSVAAGVVQTAAALRGRESRTFSWASMKFKCARTTCKR
jgi:hypothetical protein